VSDVLRYELGRCLGTGATGVVYEANDRVRGVTVAVKTLRRVDAVAFRRLKHEFRVLSDIAHPNLVALHELVATENGCFVVMDLVDGTPFMRWVRADAPMASLAAEATFEWGTDSRPEKPEAPEEAETPVGPVGVAVPDPGRVREAFRQLAEGVHALHLHGRLHRDLKPSNVLVEGSGRVVLLDFGLVSALGGAGERGPVVGTVGYMSPEQAAGRPLTPASDWYAVGTMLFEALVGVRPFVGPVSQVLADKQHLDPPDPSERVPGLPADLAGLVRALLARDPAARPSGAEIVARLGGSVPELPTGAGLVGRAHELSWLAEAWARARLGRPVLATVRGRSGIGKTALAERFLSTVTGAPVLAGRCYERESVPYKALDSVVDALAERYGGGLGQQTDLDAAASLFPVLRRKDHAPSLPDPQERRARGFRALLRLLESLSPLVVVVDDAHWGDADSAAFFAELLEATFPALVLMTWRSEEQEGSAFLRALLRVPAVRIEVDLDHLSHEDCRDLARTLLPEAGEETLESIARASGGHPLFVHELVRSNVSARSENRTSTPPSSGNLDPISSARAFPQGLLFEVDLDDAIRARVARQPASVRAMLELVATAGRKLAVSTLARATGGDPIPDLAVLRAGRLVRTSAERVEPYHDRVREAVVAGLPPERVAELHRALASALGEEPGADPAMLASHWFGAGEPERALPWALAAAQAAEKTLAFDHAAALWARARAAAPTPEQRREWSIRLGRALAAAGRPTEAADVWLALDDLPVELACLAANHLIAAGHVTRGLATLESAARRAGISVPASPVALVADLVLRRAMLYWRGLRWTPRTEPLDPQTRGRLEVCWAAVDGIAYIEPMRMAAYHARYLPLALRAGEPRAVARAFITEAGALSFSGGSADWARAEDLLAQAGRAVAATGDDELLGLLRYGTAMLAYQQHRFDEAYQIAVECERLFLERSAQAAWHVARTRILQCWCHIWRGRLLAIAELVPRLVKDAQERGNLYVATSAVTDIGYILGLARDEAEQTWEALEERERWWAEAAGGVSGMHLQHLNLAMARIQLVGYQGDLPRAYQLAEELHGRWRRSVLARGRMFQGLVVHLRARAAVGVAEQDGARRPELLRLARRAADQLERIELPHVRGSVAGLRGRIAWAEGRREQAEQHFREAVVGLDGAGILVLAHAYRRHLGALLGGAEGSALQARADDWFREQGVVRPDRFAAGVLLVGS
jgi:tetratricopeptide (TPR) repeat protein